MTVRNSYMTIHNLCVIIFNLLSKIIWNIHSKHYFEYICFSLFFLFWRYFPMEYSSSRVHQRKIDLLLEKATIFYETVDLKDYLIKRIDLTEFSFRLILRQKNLTENWPRIGKIGQNFLAQNRPKWKFYYAKWIWGTNFMK